jgi:hypothetical protein
MNRIKIGWVEPLGNIESISKSRLSVLSSIVSKTEHLIELPGACHFCGQRFNLEL